MLFVIGWFVLAIGVGALASGRDRNGFAWFLLAVVISPLLAGLALLIAGEGRPSRCPFCHERVKAEAKVCPHCRGEIAPSGEIRIETDADRAKWQSGSALRR